MTEAMKLALERRMRGERLSGKEIWARIRAALSAEEVPLETYARIPLERVPELRPREVE